MFLLESCSLFCNKSSHFGKSHFLLIEIYLKEKKLVRSYFFSPLYPIRVHSISLCYLFNLCQYETFFSPLHSIRPSTMINTDKNKKKLFSHRDSCNVSLFSLIKAAPIQGKFLSVAHLSLTGQLCKLCSVACWLNSQLCFKPKDLHSTKEHFVLF